MFLNQTFSPQDLAVVGLLVVLEGLLSIDNALVLGLLARRVPKRLQARALTYGLVGAFVFRILAIGAAAYLLKWRVVKLLGGGYLIYIAVRHLLLEVRGRPRGRMVVGPDGGPVLSDEQGGRLDEVARESQIRAHTVTPIPKANAASGLEFWWTVGVIEVTDIAFAVDSILAAIALVGAGPADQIHPKLWVVITGGMLGVILMRFAAVVFLKLLERFPRFETLAYLLVAVIGGKLLVDWHFNVPGEAHPRVDFHSPGTPAFWVLWGLMLACFLLGFLPGRKGDTHSS